MSAVEEGSKLRRLWARARRLVSRIGLRLLLFNGLLVFLPLGAMLTLDSTERRLLEAQERSMVQQGRLVAAALADPSAVDDERRLRQESAVALLWRLRQQTTSRIRVYDRMGQVLADSSALGPRRGSESGGEGAASAAGSPGPAPRDLRRRLLYRAGAMPFRLWQDLRQQVRRLRGWFSTAVEERGANSAPQSAAPGLGTPPGDSLAVVRRALEGNYAAASRRFADERATTMFSALPIRSSPLLMLGLSAGSAPGSLTFGTLPIGPAGSGEVVGVVLVSQSTAQILADLDEARIEVGRVIVFSLLAAALLSLYLAGTIARPLRRLRRDAEGLLDAGGRLVGEISTPRRYDEIGDLRDALRALARRLRKQQQAAESFAADTAHELKNPLAAIRSAAEVLATVEAGEDRERFLGLIQSNVARAEQLLSSLRELAAIDAGLEEDLARVELSGSSALPACDLARLAGELVANRAAAGDAVVISGDRQAFVRGRPERLEQVVENLVDNALSFSPPDQPVEVKVVTDSADRSVVLRVSDHGPGIPEADLVKVFRRFYSYRPEGVAAAEPGHAGLGLAIVRSVVEAYGGQVLVRNAAGGGAVFECRLPLLT